MTKSFKFLWDLYEKEYKSHNALPRCIPVYNNQPRSVYIKIGKVSFITKIKNGIFYLSYTPTYSVDDINLFLDQYEPILRKLFIQMELMGCRLITFDENISLMIKNSSEPTILVDFKYNENRYLYAKSKRLLYFVLISYD